MPEFVLQFPIEDVHAYASRFQFSEEDEALAVGAAARRRGHYTLDEFVRVCRWKSVRSSSHVARNSADAVHEATRTALADSTLERERMRALLSLHGVAFPTASTLLHLAYPERYPILDQRALQALGFPLAARVQLSVLDCVRERVRRSGRAGPESTDARSTAALWQWSKEHGSPLR